MQRKQQETWGQAGQGETWGRTKEVCNAGGVVAGGALHEGLGLYVSMICVGALLRGGVWGDTNEGGLYCLGSGGVEEQGGRVSGGRGGDLCWLCGIRFQGGDGWETAGLR